MWDWDEGVYANIPTNDIVDAIYYAWNYECDVYKVGSEELVFSGREDDDTNSELLEPYGLRMIEHDGLRKLQSIETGEIHNAPWEE